LLLIAKKAAKLVVANPVLTHVISCLLFLLLEQSFRVRRSFCVLSIVEKCLRKLSNAERVS
jgi:hypothetical protein